MRIGERLDLATIMRETNVRLAKENLDLYGGIDVLRSENAVLQVKVDRLLSLRHLERRAKTDLNMVYPNPHQVVFVPLPRQTNKKARGSWLAFLRPKKHG